MAALLRDLPIEFLDCAECNSPDHLLFIGMKASGCSFPQNCQHADVNCPRLVGWNDECKQLKENNLS